MSSFQASLQSRVAALASEFGVVSSTIREKGAKRFSKPLALAGALAAGAYLGLYAPAQKKLSFLQAEIDRSRAMSVSGAQFKDLRDQLSAAYAGLPAPKDREQWLSNAMIDSVRAEGLVPESFLPVQEQRADGLVFQTSKMNMSLDFPKFFSWLIRVEGAKPLMRVQSLDLSKKAEPLGQNALGCEVMTVIPEGRPF